MRALRASADTDGFTNALDKIAQVCRSGDVSTPCDSPKVPRPTPISYIDALLNELTEIEREYVEIIEASEIRYVNPNTGGGVFFVGAADWGWASSDDALTGRRMRLLRRVRDWGPRFRLLFLTRRPR